MFHTYLNGRIVPESRARISVFDRGLMYGDGLFETMRSYRGKPFGLIPHLARLRASAAALGIPVPQLDWPEVIGRLLERNELVKTDAWVRVMVTRGAGEPTLLPPPGLKPTVIVLARPVDPRIIRYQRRGVSVVVLSFGRESSFAAHKGLNYASGILGKQQAHERGAHDGIYSVRGQIREATTATVFAVRSGVLLTPRISGILPGVTRRFVIEVARANQLTVREGKLETNSLRTADEAFLTSSVAEIVPVTSVDGKTLGKGVPGPITREVQHLYRKLVRSGS